MFLHYFLNGLFCREREIAIYFFLKLRNLGANLELVGQRGKMVEVNPPKSFPYVFDGPNVS